MAGTECSSISRVHVEITAIFFGTMRLAGERRLTDRDRRTFTDERTRDGRASANGSG